MKMKNSSAILRYLKNYPTILISINWLKSTIMKAFQWLNKLTISSTFMAMKKDPKKLALAGASIFLALAIAIGQWIRKG